MAHINLVICRLNRANVHRAAYWTANPALKVHTALGVYRWTDYEWYFKAEAGSRSLIGEACHLRHVEMYLRV